MFKFFKILCTTDGEKLRGGADSRHSVSKRKIRYTYVIFEKLYEEIWYLKSKGLCSIVTWVVKFQPAVGLKGKTMYRISS